MPKPKLLIVIASTRPGRVGLPVARWFEEHARAHDGFDVSVADLAELDLPFMDEPNHPRLQQYTQQHTKDWSGAVGISDAFAFVMPEYNHGLNAPLKNAIDFLHNEWMYKPVGLVSYGGVSGGTRAAQMVKQVVLAVKLLPVSDAVSIPFVKQFVDDDGLIQPNEVMQQSATVMLDELVRVEAALRPLRTGPG
jgi:NAD(P)H-dependent FMN reductase